MGTRKHGWYPRVSSLIDYNFHQLACGHSITVALTISGHVFTVGSTVHGQLGNPLSDGRIPCLVQDKLVTESVDEIACGAFHVAVLTSRSEVFTWGKGANGSLGHGDIEDRKTPTLVEALNMLKVYHVGQVSRQAYEFTSGFTVLTSLSAQAVDKHLVLHEKATIVITVD